MSKNHPRMPLRQLLSTDTCHPDAVGARFWAVVLDENRKPLAKIPIYTLGMDSEVELAIDRETLFPVKE